MLCQYKDVLGKPNEGVHSYRLFNIAIVDLLLTIIASIYIANRFDISYLIAFSILFVLGIILHIVFCVETTVIKNLKSYC